MIVLSLLLATAPSLSAADRASAFKAAGAVRRGSKWVICTDDPQTSGAMLETRDLNGDGRPEAIVTEDGSFCHGADGTGFVLLSKGPDGSWRKMAEESGVPDFLATKSAGGWPDLSVGGPGFCFPVMRWNGRAYALHRHEYEGKPCRPGR